MLQYRQPSNAEDSSSDRNCTRFDRDDEHKCQQVMREECSKTPEDCSVPALVRTLTPRCKALIPLVKPLAHPTSTVNHQIPSNNTKNNKTKPAKKKPSANPSIIVKTAIAKRVKPRQETTARAVTTKKTQAYRPTFDMSPCALDYLRVLYNPFDVGVNPCIPGITPTPSMKYKATTRGVFQVGTQGVGGVAFWPVRMCSRSPIYNTAGTHQYPAIIATNSTYAGLDYAFTNAASITSPAPADLLAFYGSTSPFDAVSLGAPRGDGSAVVACGRSLKLVGAGIRVQYVDKVLDMSGDYITWRNPNPTSALPGTADNLADLLALNSAAMNRVSDAYNGVTYNPVLETDLSAMLEPANVAGLASTTLSNRLACGVFVANAQPGQRFAFEAVAFYELSGTGVSVTASHSDPHAMGAILAINNPVVNPNMQAAESGAFAALSSAVREMGYSAVRALGRGIGESIFSMARGH